MHRMLALFASIVAPLRNTAAAYNPERHYMRGPGPKWREKHATQGEPPIRIDGAGRIVSSRC